MMRSKAAQSKERAQKTGPLSKRSFSPWLVARVNTNHKKQG